ncbi:restriction endonuclease subunit S [Limosilactobacillus reuteri]|uniref:restriction endonuclease subunit S n=2 Tax=Limosilactobacillus reuteri TaxID=1598 RepID=UPI003D054646
MMKLTDREWDTFRIDEIFDNISRPISRSKNQYVSGDVPFIASGASLNGAVAFCTPKNDERLDAANCITVSPVDGSCFYQPTAFLGRGGGGSSIIILRSNNLNRNNGVFLAMAVNHTTSKYQYGHMATSDGIKREQILLPVNDKDQPDYQFMADYERELIQQKHEKYLNYAKNCLSQLGIPVELDPLDEKKWAPFFLNEVFDVNSGVRLTNQDKENGKKPFIGATDNGNGITGFVGNTNKSQDSNVLGVNYNGAPGIAFYHPYTALFSDDVKRLKLKDESHNTKNVLLFMASIVMKQRGKYSYGYKFNASRMNRQRLYLPVNNQGQPDYDYMEQYIKNKMIQKYKKYLEYLGK